MTSKSEESKIFQHSVYETVKLIPSGHISTYGHIALLLGKPGNSRQVGQILKLLHFKPTATVEQDSSSAYDYGSVPWWRVINSQGKISERGIPEMQRQRELLISEGVLVSDDGRFKVLNMRDVGWFEDDVEVKEEEEEH
ncbi:hypothetical protein WICPIJ_007713 [Wickerhamomyces pijperi]|uniref:6-O-methylguanine-DNA methyltransferase n=1 Tax=Wickerhamomyces pijperi TaxID=599730 RepID=A0A9P8PZP5_WICPI|nr:hypothetical protein WICPIJ_007713 [Wickerhamomyces pijperi]